MLPRSLLASAPLVAFLAACNGLTGVNNLSVAGQQGGNGGGSGTGTGTGTGTATSTGTGTGTGTSSSSGATSSLVAAQGVTISQIAIYQGPKLLLMGGTQTGKVDVPVVAGREALVRVFVTTDATYDGTPVTAQLFVGQGSTTPIQVVGAVNGAPTEASLGSTINFDVPAAAIVAGVEYRVELLQPPASSKGGNAAASYPASGFAPLGAASDGAQLKLVIVPIQYGADGSNRLPDTSAAQLQGYKDAFTATYPIDALQLSVGAPFPWTEAVSPDGTGWSDLLDGLATYRQQQNAGADVYYFGAFQPGASFAAYCGSGCVAGLGLIGGPTDTYSRAAIGLGFTDPTSFTTAIHEIGHTQGRSHAPCGGAQNVDPSFPYAKGDIGDSGYNIVLKQLLQPGQASDMMGYCTPVWISDYTFNAIFQEMKLVNGAELLYPPSELDRLWERARVDMAGNLEWLPSVPLHVPPAGQATPVTVTTAGGSATAAGQYFSYDHIPGGVLLWPAGASAAASIRVAVGGQSKTLSR